MESSRETDKAALKDIVDYYKANMDSFNKVNPFIYWVDLLTVGLLFWGAFMIAYLSSSWLVSAVFYFSASCLLYRGLSFSHEIVHHQKIKLFRLVWDLLFGIPFLYPSYLYNSHLDHHSKDTYGTKDDPEYILINGSKKRLVLFFIQSIFIPAASMIRCLIFPFMLLSTRAYRIYLQKFSQVSINPNYKGKTLKGKVKLGITIESFICSILLYTVIILVLLKIVSANFILFWYGLFGIVAILNYLRFLACTHNYQNLSHKSFTQQVADSVNYDKNSFLAIIIAPVGMRYHALHHLFPAIPYHSLRKAHIDLCEHFAENKTYENTITHSLWEKMKYIIGKKGKKSMLTAPKSD